MDENCKKYFNVHSFDFKNYVILDDDNDFLIEQQPNLFQCDPWCGVTITIEDNIRRFFGGKRFPNVTN